MSRFKREDKRAISESARPTTTSQKDTPNSMSRRRFLTLFGAGVIATGLFGAKVLAGEPEKPVHVASATVTAGKKVETPGDKQSFNYTLSVNSMNAFVGEPILISLVDSKGNLARGSKVEVTEPSGNTFMVSIDNLQNGFIARTAGVYTVEYGSTKLVVTVREMDAELKALDPVSIAEIEGYVRSEYNTFTYKLNGTNIEIYDSTGTKRQVSPIDMSKLLNLKRKFDGNGIEPLVIGFETGTDPKLGGYFQLYIIPCGANGELIRGMPFAAQTYVPTDKSKGMEYGVWYGRLH